jgi:hypothetical protein
MKPTVKHNSEAHSICHGFDYFDGGNYESLVERVYILCRLYYVIYCTSFNDCHVMVVVYDFVYSRWEESYHDLYILLALFIEIASKCTYLELTNRMAKIYFISW